MRPFSNSLLRGEIILEELLYIFAMVTLISTVYYLTSSVERKFNEYLCNLQLNIFLNEFTRNVLSFREIGETKIHLENPPRIIGYGFEVCSEYGGSICCRRANFKIYGILSEEILISNGEVRLH